MINPRSIDATSSLQFGTHFVRPDYGGYCFAHIPDTILRLFGLSGEGSGSAPALSAASPVIASQSSERSEGGDIKRKL